MTAEEKESSTDPLHEARERRKIASEAWAEDRLRYVEDVEFLHGDHWPEAVKKQRETDNRPCLVIDKLKQYVRQVVNDSRQNRPSIKVRPVDSGADVKVADVLQGYARHVEERSSADVAYDTALECAVSGGFGFVRVLTEYAHEGTFDQELCIKRVRNPLTVLLDPNCQEADGSDARFAFVEEDLPEDEYEAQYPDAEKVDWESDEKYADWYGEKKVKVAEYWWVEEEDRTMHQLADGSICSDEEYQKAISEGLTPPTPVQSRTMKVKKVKWARINGADYLEGPKDWPGKWIPIVPIWGNEVEIDGKVIHTSMIHDSKDAQRLYDYSRSAFAERVALTPKAPFIAAAGQVEDFEDDWKNANTQNIAVLKYTPQDVSGTPVPPPRRESASDIPAGFAQDMQMSEHDIQSTLGMYNASLGQQSNEKSGRAILARQKEGDVTNFHYHDNLARAIRHVGRIIVDLAPKILDSTRVIRILGMDGTADMAQIDPNLPQAVQKVQGVEIFNIGVGTYDVAVSAGPSYTTRRQEAADAMVQLTQGNPALFPLIGDLMIKSMDWPMADAIAQRLKIMLPPQIQQAEQREGERSPEVMAIMAQAEQMQQQADQVMAQAAEEIQRLTQENEQLKAEQQTKQAEVQIKAREVQIKEFEAQTERMQVEASAQTEQINAMAAIQQPQEQASIEQPPQMDVAAILQAVASMHQPINITVPVQVDGKGASVKQGRAVRMPDGSYTLESVETPVEQ